MRLLRRQDPPSAEVAEQPPAGAVPAEPAHRGELEGPAVGGSHLVVDRSRSRKPSWELAEGDELAPGRTVVAPLGGGNRYEVFLVWDEHRYALLVAKVLRPNHVDSAIARADLEAEAEALQMLAHPVLVRGFGADP